MLETGSSPAGNGASPGGEGRGEPVDPSTGVFVMEKTDLYLSDTIPLSLTRIYNSGDNLARPFGRGMSHPYALFLWSANQYTEADLVLPAGGKIHYVRTSPGSGYSDAVFMHKETATTSATPTPFYKSVLAWNGHGWNLTLTDGTVFVFGENAPLQSIRDRYGNTVTVAHSQGQSGQVTRVTSPNGRWIAFSYDAAGRIAQASDNANRTVTYAYDLAGNLSTVTDAEHGVTTYTYSAANQLASIRDPRNITYLTNTYANGRVAVQTLADPSATYRFDYTLDASGAITRTDVTDPRGHVERLLFNADHYIISDTSAVGLPEQRTTTIDRQAGTNFVTARTDAIGRRTEFAYDGFGHVSTATRLAGTPDASTTTITYEPRFFQIAMATDPLGHTWTASYDMTARLTGFADPLGRRTAVTINPVGQVVSVSDPLQHTWQIAYLAGDLLHVADPAGGIHALQTDAVGRVIGARDPLGRTTRLSWDKLGLLTSTTDAANGRTAVGYDGNGNPLSVTDALNHATRYAYDTSDRVTARTDPTAHVETWEYDGNDNVTRAVDRKGQLTMFAYDGLDRLSQTTFSDGSTISYAYDAADRVTQIVDSVNGSITRTYDGLDRLLSESTANGTISYTYDAADRRTTMTAPGQNPAIYAYDAADQLLSVSQDAAVVSFSYDAAGRRTGTTYPNGVSASLGFDERSLLVSAAYTAGRTLLGDLTYTYDAAGNRTAMGGSWARTGLPPPLLGATYDEANRVSGWNGRPFTYDADGNLVSDGVTAFGWSARNLLTSVVGSAPAVFQYDAMGRRRGKTVGGVSTSFIYDGMNVVQERSGASVATMLNGLGLDEAVWRSDNGGSALVSDPLGSTLALVDAAGTTRTQYTYDPFGGTTTTGAASANAAQFTGREAEGTGLYYLRARYYSPEQGRFLSEDPLGFGGGDVNVYAYVGNRPTQSTDPLGLYEHDVHWDLTNRTGRQVGLCAADAANIAYADQGVDDWWHSSPMPFENIVARRLFHFTTHGRLEQLRRNAFDTGSTGAMGIYLHALQDSYSHQRGRKDREGDPFGPFVGHFFRGHGPDRPRTRPDLWRHMSEHTARELFEFQRRFPACRVR
jgi:RHS repeat-associated protein